MGKTPYNIIHALARLDDPAFVKWAAFIGLTPRTTMPGAESMLNFRLRVIDHLDRMDEMISDFERSKNA